MKNRRSRPQGARERELIAIAGCTGSGKTTIARWLLDTRGPESRLILDPLGTRDSSLAWHAADAIYTDHRKLFSALLQLAPGDVFRAAYVPRSGAEPSAAGWLASVAQWIGRRVGPLWLVIEEAGRSAPLNICPPKLREVAQTGRHDGISLLAVSQRPSSIHPDVRAELAAGEAWFGRLVDWNDRGYLRERRGTAFADRAGTLEVIQESGWARWLRLQPSGQPEEWRVSYSGASPRVEPIRSPIGNESRKATAGGSISSEPPHLQQPQSPAVPGSSVSQEPVKTGPRDESPKRSRRRL